MHSRLRRYRPLLRPRSIAALLVLVSGCVRAADPRMPGRAGPSSDDESQQVTPTLVNSADAIAPAVDAVTEDLRVLDVLHGEATYYADKFEGRRTASGITFRQREAYAAHRTLPFGTVVRVTNERNGRSVVVRIVDRGPWGSVAQRRNTIIDLSRSAAEQLDYIRAGRTPVRVEVLLMGSG